MERIIFDEKVLLTEDFSKSPLTEEIISMAHRVSGPSTPLNAYHVKHRGQPHIAMKCYIFSCGTVEFAPHNSGKIHQADIVVDVTTGHVEKNRHEAPGARWPSGEEKIREWLAARALAR